MAIAVTAKENVWNKIDQKKFTKKSFLPIRFCGVSAKYEKMSIVSS